VTKKIRTGHGSMYVTMNDDEFGPRECFVILGKPGGTAAAFSDALGRMITMALTHGASPAEVVHQLRGIQDGHPAGVGPNAVLSVPDGVARAMSEYYLIEESLPDTRELPIIGACPDCGSGLTRRRAALSATPAGTRSVARNPTATSQGRTCPVRPSSYASPSRRSLSRL
jgi:ribonucleoside-diphosphate reductase alpha chain